MLRVISVSNPKGGVGKTTAAINLAASLAIADKKVLLIDLDPNGSVASGLGLNHHNHNKGILEVFLGTTDLLESAHPVHPLKMDVIPCSVRNNEQETRLLERAKNRGYLNRKIGDLNLKGKVQYDFIIIDTPPGLNDLTISSLCASTSVVIPLQCGYFALKVVERLLRMVQRLKNSINPDLRVEGILLNFFDKGTKESQRAAANAHRLSKNLVFRTAIPKNTALGFAAFEKKPAVLIDASAAGSIAYLNLADEILRNNRLIKTNSFHRKQQQSNNHPKYAILEC